MPSGHLEVMAAMLIASLGMIAQSSRGSPHIAISPLDIRRRCIKVEPERHPAERINTGDSESFVEVGKSGHLCVIQFNACAILRDSLSSAGRVNFLCMRL